MALLLVLLLAACSPAPKEVRQGSRVRLHYALGQTGTRPGPPVTAVIGQGQLPPGLEAALLGLKAGARKRVTLKPEAAYGLWDPAKVSTAPASAFAGLGALEPGMTVRGTLGGAAAEARVMSTGAVVALDFNHPLAGRELTFEVELVAVD